MASDNHLAAIPSNKGFEICVSVNKIIVTVIERLDKVCSKDCP